MATPQEREVFFEIIENYRNMPLLWDKEHEDYKNIHKRNIANKMLLEIYKKIDANAALPTLVKKILNLRTNYFRELRKVKESIADGGGIYEPTIWYYKAFSFLEGKGPSMREVIRNYWRNNDNSSNSQHEDSLISEFISPTTSDEEGSCHYSETQSPVFNRRGSAATSETPSSPPAKLRKFTNPIAYKNKNDTVEPAAEPSQKRREECEIYGKAIGLQLRDLDRKQLTITQKIISDTIYYANFGLLTEKAYVNLGSPPPNE